MYNKVLFVGLGGSGGKTLRFIKREMNRWLDSHGITSGIPSGWQFLWIDTPTQPDGGEIDGLADRLEDTEYLGLVAPGAQLVDFVNALDANPDATHELRTWRVNPATTTVAVAMGAGQFRAVGQTIALASVSRIKAECDRAFAAINSDGDKDLAELYTQVHNEPPSAFENQTHIIIVSSLSGGTGAGLLNTVCDILRVHPESNAADNLFGFLYTPEVFDSLGAAAIGGVQPNSLAAISELLNGYWWAGDASEGAQQSHESAISPIPAALLQSAGLATNLTKSGPEYPFLVGRVGAGNVAINTPSALFQLVGRSLVSLITNKDASDSFFPYIVANYSNASIQANVNDTDVLVNKGPHGTPPFQAVGFSRVSLGTDYFEDYTTRRITKDAISHLTKWHAASPDAKRRAIELETDDQEKITLELAKPFLIPFLQQSGISEYGAEDEILDALVPDNDSELAKEALSNVQRLSEHGSSDKKPITEWKAQIRDAKAQVLRDYDLKHYGALTTRATIWVKKEVPDQIAAAIENLLSNVGLVVAEKVCRLAAAHMSKATHDDLIERDLAGAEKLFDEEEQYGIEQAFGGSDGKIEGNHELIGQAVKRVVQAILLRGRIQKIKMAADLCKGIGESVLLPAANALRDARVGADSDFLEIDEYPEWNDAPPPESVLPPEGDFSLIDPVTYPEDFSRLLTETTEMDGEEAARTEVRSDVISGRFLRKPGVDEKAAKEFFCVNYSQPWWPRHILGGSVSENQTNAVFDIAVSVHDIEERTHEWLRRDNTAFAKHLSISLRDYLGNEGLFDDSDLTESQVRSNQQNFINSCQAAVRAAEPLLNIDSALLNTVHPGYVGRPNQIFMSDVPLEGHSLAEEVETRFIALGIDKTKFNFVNDQSIRHIDITTTLPGPHSILVAESLLKPIAGAWTKSKNNPENFWKDRRSQRPERFTPVPQSILLAMCRGWIIAGLLGRLERDEHNNDKRKPIVIWRKHEQKQVGFPNPVLTATYGRDDHIAVVMEALPLAYVECSTLSNLSPLDPYIELRDLGTSPSAQMITEYDRFHPDISRWIETGELEDSDSISKPLLKSLEIEIPEDATEQEQVAHRAAVLKERLIDSRETYKKRMDARIQEERKSKVAIGLGDLLPGLHTIWDRAHEDLIEAAKGAGEAFREDSNVVG